MFTSIPSHVIKVKLVAFNAVFQRHLSHATFPVQLKPHPEEVYNNAKTARWKLPPIASTNIEQLRSTSYLSPPQCTPIVWNVSRPHIPPLAPLPSHEKPPSTSDYNFIKSFCINNISQALSLNQVSLTSFPTLLKHNKKILKLLGQLPLKLLLIYIMKSTLS